VKSDRRLPGKYGVLGDTCRPSFIKGSSSFRSPGKVRSAPAAADTTLTQKASEPSFAALCPESHHPLKPPAPGLSRKRARSSSSWRKPAVEKTPEKGLTCRFAQTGYVVWPADKSALSGESCAHLCAPGFRGSELREGAPTHGRLRRGGQATARPLFGVFSTPAPPSERRSLRASSKGQARALQRWCDYGHKAAN